MDIIAEILETDRLAEETLEKARTERAELLADCEKRLAEIEENARREVEEHRAAVEDSSRAAADERAKEVGEGFEADIAALEEKYNSCHETWESEIIAAVIA